MDVISNSSLHKLQVYQGGHDRTYHHDISLLPCPHQLAHFALHFAKYARRLTRRAHGEGYDFEQTLADIFIITLSATNLIGFDLGAELDREQAILLVYGSDVSVWLLDELVYHGGTIAKACESLEDMEAYSYKVEVKKALLGIARAVTYAAAASHLDIKLLVAHRWQYIEFNQIL